MITKEEIENMSKRDKEELYKTTLVNLLALSEAEYPPSQQFMGDITKEIVKGAKKYF